MSGAGSWADGSPQRSSGIFDPRWTADAATAAGPPLLFGLRLWASVCLALYVAFWVELDNAFWAGTSAAVVCQPRLGASLRKGWFRMIGTVVGAVATSAHAAPHRARLTIKVPRSCGKHAVSTTIATAPTTVPIMRNQPLRNEAPRRGWQTTAADVPAQKALSSSSQNAT